MKLYLNYEIITNYKYIKFIPKVTTRRTKKTFFEFNYDCSIQDFKDKTGVINDIYNYLIHELKLVYIDGFGADRFTDKAIKLIEVNF